MDSFLSVDGYGGLGGLDYLFSGLGSLFGDDYYGYDDYSYYDDYDLSFSVGGLGGLFGGLFDDLGYLFGDYGYGYYDDYDYSDYSYDDYEIGGNIDDVFQVGSDILNGLDDEIDVNGLISGLPGGDGDLSGLSDILSGLLGGDTALTVDGELGDLSGLSNFLANFLGGVNALTVDGELGDLSGLSDLLAGLLGGDTTLSVDGTSDLLSGLLGGNGLDLSALLSGLFGSDTTLSVDGTSDLLSGLLGGNGLDLSSLLSGLLGGGTTLSVDGSTASSSGLDLSALTGLLGGLTGGTASSSSLDLSSLSSLLGGLTGGTASTSGIDLSSLLSGLLGGGTTISVDGTTASSDGLDLSSLSSLLGGLTGGTASTSGLDLSTLTGLLGGLTGGTTSTSGLDLSSLLSGLLGGTTISVDGTTASTGSTNILSALGNLGNLGNLFSGLTGIMSGIGSGDLDGFELLDSLTDLYNGAGISVDGSTASTGSADLLSGLSGLLGGNGISSLLSGLLGGGTASSGGLDLSSLLSGLLGGGTTSVSATASDTTSTNSSYNIIGLVNLISEAAALNGGQDVSSSTGTIIQISDDTWNMMQTMSVLNSILPGEDIYVNSNGKQGIVLSTDVDSLQAALKPYNDYLTVDDLTVGLSITIDDYIGIQKAIALAKEDLPSGAGDDPGTQIVAPTTSSDVATTDPEVLTFDGIPFDSTCIHRVTDLNIEDFPALLIPCCDAFQVELESMREVGFWLDDASMDMGAQNWDGWDIRAIGDFQGDGVDDLLLSHSQTGIMVLLGDSDLSKWDSLNQFVTDDPVSVGAIPADAAGLRMVGDAAQWLASGGASANWIILA